jgi:DNA-binding response OmpR family regulator
MPLPVEQREDKGMTDQRQSIMSRQSVLEPDGASALVITTSEPERIFVKAALDGLLGNLRFTTNGIDALATLAAEPVAVVIVDGDAEAPSWRELLGQISRHEAGSAPRLIVMSRLADDRMWAEVLNLGAYDLLPRPLAADELAWVVRSALSDRNGSCGSARQVGVMERSTWNGY